MSAPTITPWARRLLPAIGFIAGGILLALLAAELALRLIPGLFSQQIGGLAQVARQRMAFDRAITSDPALGLKLRPNLDFQTENPEFRHRYKTYLNYADIGFRGNAAERPLLGVALGDSFTFGIGVEAEEAWPEQLSKQIGKNIVNLGVMGYSPPQYTIILGKYGIRLAPKLILYAVYQNDLRDSDCFALWRREGGLFQCAARQTPSASYKWFLARNLILYHLYRQLSEPEPVRGEYHTDTRVVVSEEMLSITQTASSREGRVPAQQAILEAKAIADRQGAAFVLVLIPSKEQSHWPLLKETLAHPSRYDIDGINRTVLDFCGNSGLRCLDLTPVFREATAAGNQLYYRVNAHFNAEGHRLAARTIYDYLINNRSLERVKHHAGERTSARPSYMTHYQRAAR